MNGGGLARWSGPLLILAFAAVGVSRVNAVFSGPARWVVLAGCAVLVLPHGFPRGLYGTRFMLASMIYAGYAALSSIWSEAPQLSALKGGAFLVVMTTGATAGYLWVRYSRVDRALDLLGPLLVLAVGAGVLGTEGASIKTGEGVDLYQGATSNPNYLGALCAMALPLPAWKWMSGGRGGPRMGWMALCAVLVVAVIFSRSRAAMLILLCIGAGVWSVLGLRRKRLAGVPIFLGAALALLLAPGLRDMATDDLVFKGNRGAGVLASRQGTWGESWDAAVQGAVWGLGYGVSAGADASSVGMTSTLGYGREKGNTQLGIVEELGIVGLLLYLASTVALFSATRRAAVQAGSSTGASVLRMVIAALVGITLHSVFEAWYNAPGAMESMYYWVLAGVAMGLATDPRLCLPVADAMPTGFQPVGQGRTA